jgi:fatty-acyl-CoA synthase
MNRNPFSSDWLGSHSDERLRPQGGLSYVAGPGDEPLRFITVPTLLHEAVAAHGARDAAVFAATGTRWSWYDLQNKADQVAAGLLALGINRGDRVGIWAPNCEEWLGMQFGAARIGAILVNINPAYREYELEYALNKVQCRVLRLRLDAACTRA